MAGFYGPILKAGASGAFDARNGGYAGKTKQSLPVSFTVKNDKVKKPKFKIDLGGCTVTDSSTATARISDRGKFKVDMGSDYLKGKFVTRSKVKGSAHTEPYGCPSGTVSYTAHHK